MVPIKQFQNKVRVHTHRSKLNLIRNRFWWILWMIMLILGNANAGIVEKIFTSNSIFSPLSVYADTNGDVFVAGGSSISLHNYITKIYANGTVTNFLDTYPIKYVGEHSVYALFGDTNGNIYFSDTYYCVYKSTSSGYSVVHLCVIGTSSSGHNGAPWTPDGNHPNTTNLNSPWGMFIDSGGVMYVTDTAWCVVRKFTLPYGIVSTVIGSNGQSAGTCGIAADGSAGTSTPLSNPWGIWIDSLGSLYVAEHNNFKVRKLLYNSDAVTTIAGNGTNHYCSDNVAATSTCIPVPVSVVVDTSGNIYVGDDGGKDYRVRKILANGIITTYVGTGSSGSASATNVDATSVQIGNNVIGLFMDSNGVLYVADFPNSKLLVIGYSTPSPTPTTYPTEQPAKPSSQPSRKPSMQPSVLPSSQPSNHPSKQPVLRPSVQPSCRPSMQPSTQPTIQPTSLPTGRLSHGKGVVENIITSNSINAPLSVYADTNGHIFMAGNKVGTSPNFHNYITKIYSNGTVTNFLDAYPIIYYNADGIFAVFGDTIGDLYFSDQFYCVYKSTSKGYSVAHQCVMGTGASGNSGNGGAPWTPDGHHANSTVLNQPWGLFIDSTGVMYVSDYGFCVVRKFALPYGIVSTIIGSNGQSAGTCGASADGLPGTSTYLKNPWGIWLDTVGSLYIVENNNYKVRILSRNTGKVETVAGNGTDYSNGDNAAVISKPIPFPLSVAVDTLGNIFIGDYGQDYRVAKVSKTGNVTTYVGTGVPGSATNIGVDATSVPIQNGVYGLFVDSSGTLYVPDYLNSKLLVIGYSTPSPVPTVSPTKRPTSQPSRRSSSKPSVQPSRQPTSQPTAHYSFYFTGTVQNFTVPANVYSLRIDMTGGAGGNVDTVNSTSYGARVQTTLHVIPGQIYHIFVGGQGSASVTGGWNGGGAGSSYAGCAVPGGGGASDIRFSGTSLTNRIVVAGGAGGNSVGCGSRSGGAGGFNGSAGFVTTDNTCFGYGKYAAAGGTQTSGGEGGGGNAGCGPAPTSGALGVGGTGGCCSGGGGGGGYFGGGGGPDGSGGGGGSSMSQGYNTVYTTGYEKGNGYVIIYLDYQPSSQPTIRPSSQPSLSPRNKPTSQPSRQPSSKPSTPPSCRPIHPTGQPSVSPSTAYSYYYSYTGNVQNFTVPAEVTAIYVDMVGATSGTNGNGTAGRGARVQTTISVTAGSQLFIFVGGQGTNFVVSMTSSGLYYPGGWNGGGKSFGAGTGGGGATDIRIGGMSLLHRYVVAGGGGGYYAGGYCGRIIGGNGGYNGSDGGPAGAKCMHPNNPPGKGGTQTFGGTAGNATFHNPPAPTAGTLGVGGNGGYLNSGGGGGGYYGGGGGIDGGGAGGGSSHSRGYNTTYTSGYWNGGNGFVRLVLIYAPTSQPTSRPSDKPSNLPSSCPSIQPTTHPSIQPSIHATDHPTAQPGKVPSSTPSIQPVGMPTCLPTRRPDSRPSAIPSAYPSMPPSARPSGHPSGEPTMHPSARPSGHPSGEPTMHPSARPSGHPSGAPTAQPTGRPSSGPSCQSTAEPSILPSGYPSSEPSMQPIILPTMQPVSVPSAQPSTQPSRRPSTQPGSSPTGSPSIRPTSFPTKKAHKPVTKRPSVRPTKAPSLSPTTSPSLLPTVKPSIQRPVEYLYLTSSSMSSDGTYTDVIFNKQTNKALLSGIFACNLVLGFGVGSSNFGNSNCMWFNSSAIRILASVDVGSKVGLHNSSLQIYCDPLLASDVCPIALIRPFEFISIQRPSNPIAPHVVINAPKTISSCGNLVLDLTQSSGNLGKAWSNVSVIVASVPISPNISQIMSTILSEFSTIYPMVIENNLLEVGTTYYITVQLCNTFRSCSSANCSSYVDVSSLAPPVVSIAGSSERSLYANSSLSLFSSAYVMMCGGAKRTTGLTYSWKLLNSSGVSVMFKSTSLDSTVLTLAPFSLQAGIGYVVNVIVYDKVFGLSGSSQARVNVMISNLVAAITPSVSPLLNIGKTVRLSATSSHDPDNVNTKLSFQWMCVMIMGPSYINGCPLNLQQTDLSKTLAVTANASSVNTTSRITLTVSDQASRVASVYVSFTVTASVQPTVNILTSASQLNNVNIAQGVTIIGSVQSAVPIIASWNLINNQQLVLNNIASGTLTTKIQPNQITTMTMYLLPGMLTYASTYTFALVCGGVTLTISVTTNVPPYGGVYAVRPSTGTALQTSFALSTNAWITANLPLLFSFNFYSPSSLTWLPVQVASQISYGTSIFPAGSNDYGNNVSTSVTATDSYGAVSQAMRNVKVTNMQVQVNANVVSSLLVNASSASAVQQIIAVASASLNSINCSATPSVYCSSLHRQPCGTQSNLCGECWSGYIGTTKYGNTMCSQLASIVGNTNSSTQHTLQCSVDADCQGFQRCHANECVVASQSCPGDCSGHGNCSFVSIATGLPVVSCTVLSPTCTATCKCESGYGGLDCSTSLAELQSQQATRALLLSSLSDSLATTNVDGNSIADLSNNVNSIVTSPSDLNAHSVTAVLNVSHSIASTTITTSAPVSLSSLYSPVDYSMSYLLTNDLSIANTSSSSSSLSKAVSVVAILTQATSLQTYPGAQTISYIMNNFRVASAAFTNDLEGNTSDLTLSLSRTALETITNSQVPAVTVVSNSSNPVYAQLAQLKQQIWQQGSNATLKSNIVYINMSESYDFEITIPHIDEASSLPMSLVNQTVVNVTCGEERNITLFTCPGSNNVLNLTCVGMPGLITKYCPVLSPACKLLNMQDYSIHDNQVCLVVASTNYNTTCQCRASKYSNRRLSDAKSNIASTAMYIGAMSEYVGQSSKDTFHGAASFTTVSALGKSYVVICLFCILWGIGLLMILWSALINLKDADNNKTKHERVRHHSAAHADDAISIDANQALAKLKFYLNSVIPKVFSKEAWTHRLKNEIYKNHGYVNVWMGLKKHKEYYLQVVKLLTIFTINFMLIAMLYDLNYPNDDGSCSGHVTQQSCLVRKSMFDGTQSYCKWNAANAVCSYNAPRISFQVAVYSAVVVSMFNAIAIRPLEYMFKLLSNPTAKSVNMEVIASTVARAQAQVSIVGRRFSRALVGFANSVVPIQNSISASSKQINKIHVPVETREAYSEFRKTAKSMPDIVQRNALSRRVTDITIDEGEAIDAENRGILLLAKFKEALSMQRSLLSSMPDRLLTFDNAWHVDHSTGNFQSVMMRRYLVCSSKVSVESVLQEELLMIDKEANKGIDHVTSLPDSDAGIVLLQMFISDILGRKTLAARMFAGKVEMDFERSRPVSLGTKVLITGVLLAVNIFCIYFSMLKGYEKGYTWQKQYAIACTIQIITEVIFFETLECIWMNFCLPSLATSEVTKVHAVLEKAMETLKRLLVSDHDLSLPPLNAAEYFFVANIVARKFPSLPESKIVLCYHTCLPHEALFGVSNESITQRWSIRSMIMYSLSSFVSILLALVTIIPFELQRAAIRFFEPFLLSAIVLGWVYATSSPTFVAVFCLVTFLLGGLFWRIFREEKEKSSKVQDIKIATDDIFDIELGAQDAVKRCDIRNVDTDIRNVNDGNEIQQSELVVPPEPVHRKSDRQSVRLVRKSIVNPSQVSHARKTIVVEDEEYLILSSDSDEELNAIVKKLNKTHKQTRRSVVGSKKPEQSNNANTDNNSTIRAKRDTLRLLATNSDIHDNMKMVKQQSCVVQLDDGDFYVISSESDDDECSDDDDEDDHDDNSFHLLDV